MPADTKPKRGPGQAAFRKFYPTATIERRKPNFEAAYYLVRKWPRAFMPCGEGPTPGAAWRDAYAKEMARRESEAAKALNESGGAE